MIGKFWHGLVAAAVLALGLAGCVSGGNEVLKSQDAATVDLNIIDGTTTRAEVESIYGPPSHVSFVNERNEIWTYRWGRASPQGQNFIPIFGAFTRAVDVKKKELVIMFNERNVVIRHSMKENKVTFQRDLGSSPSPTPTSPQSSAATPPQGAPPPATPIGVPPPAGPSSGQPEAGTWACGIANIGNTSNPSFTLHLLVAADNSITVETYGGAPATIVARNPLTFTAINPRGSRLTTFRWKPDNSMIITGPGLNNPKLPFYNEGTCART